MTALTDYQNMREQAPDLFDGLTSIQPLGDGQGLVYYEANEGGTVGIDGVALLLADGGGLFLPASDLAPHVIEKWRVALVAERRSDEDDAAAVAAEGGAI